MCFTEAPGEFQKQWSGTKHRQPVAQHSHSTNAGPRLLLFDRAVLDILHAQPPCTVEGSPGVERAWTEMV